MRLFPTKVTRGCGPLLQRADTGICTYEITEGEERGFKVLNPCGGDIRGRVNPPLRGGMIIV